MKAVILARVSTLRQEQEGLSLKEMQLPRLREYAIDKGLEVVREFVFSESADLGIRNKYQEMIDYVKDNPEIQSIIAFRVDRVTRNFRDHFEADALMKDFNKEFHFVQDGLIINKNTTGRDITDWDTKVYLGKQFINRLREDAINSASYKIKNNEWPGKAPWGYRNVTQGKKKWIEPDGIKAGVVRAMFEWYSTGTCSMLQIKHKLSKEYGMELSKGQIDRILKCRFYHGEMEFKGEEYPHKYETIISPTLFAVVQDIKASYGKKTGHKFAGLPYTYRGLLSCEHCGATISPEKKKGKYVYYKCTEYHGKHGAKYIREEEITKQLIAAYKQIEVPKWVIDEITQTLRESHEDKKHYSESLLRDYRKEHDKYKTRIEKMYVDKLDGLITAEEYKSKFDDYRAKQKLMKEKIDALDKAEDTYYQSAETLLNLANRASSLFESSGSELKRVFVKLTLQNLKLKGSNLVYDWVKPFDSMLVSANCTKWLPGRGSNLRPIG